MKLRIEGDAEELSTKAFELAKSVLSRLVVHDPRLIKALKALGEDEPHEHSEDTYGFVARAKAVFEEEMAGLAEDIQREMS